MFIDKLFYYLKVDIEGSEHKLLKGASYTLKNK